MNPDATRYLLMLNAFSTWWMTGIAWFCEVVQYPLFAKVERESFIPYHAEHVRRIQRVVLIPMMIELTASFLILSESVNRTRLNRLDLAGAVLVVAVWACTFFRQVPDHRKLAAGYDAAVHHRLLQGNLVRCLFWSGHSLVVALQLFRRLG